MHTVCAHFWYSFTSDFTTHSEKSNIKTVDAQQARIINLYSMCILLALFYIRILYPFGAGIIFLILAHSVYKM